MKAQKLSRQRNHRRSEQEKMNGEKNAYGDSSERRYQAARDGQQSRERLTERPSIIALPCEVCGELCPSDKLMEHQIECQREQENTRRNDPRVTHNASPVTQEFVFNVHDFSPSQRSRYIEVQRGYSPTIEFEDDCVANKPVEDDIAIDAFAGAERSTVYVTPQGEDPSVTRSGNDMSSATYIEIQRSYSPMMEFEEEDTPEAFSLNIREFVHTRDSTNTLGHLRLPRFN